MIELLVFGGLSIVIVVLVCMSKITDWERAEHFWRKQKLGQWKEWKE